MELFEGGMMILATLMLTYMILWMQREARTLKANLHGRMGSALLEPNSRPARLTSRRGE